MGEEVLLQAIELALDALVTAVIVEEHQSEYDANSKISWGNVTAGTGSYTWQDADNIRSTVQCDWYFTTKPVDGMHMMSSQDGAVEWIYRGETTGSGNAPIIQFIAGDNMPIRWTGETFYTVDCVIHGTQDYTTNLTAADILSNPYSQMMYTANGSRQGYHVCYAGTGGSTWDALQVNFTTNSAYHTRYPETPYAPIASGQYSFNEVRDLLIDWGNDYLLSQDPTAETINESDVADWKDFFPVETETETSSGGGCGNCNCTTIYVNADGSLTLQNDISGDFDLAINNDADLSLNVAAAAGAFGAGAVVVDPDAVINVNTAAGAFGAGAFGAGAIGNVAVSGSLDVGDVSGELNITASGDINISGGDIAIDQSGATNNNTYNNYYFDSTEPTETINYNEILSEDELESILQQETYQLATFTDDTIADIQILDTIPAEIQPLPGELITVSNDVVNYGSDLVTDVGLTPIYAPLAMFSFVCFVLRGCK